MSSRFLTAGGGLLPGFSKAGSASAAFDPASVFGAGDTGYYWSAASLSDIAQNSNGTGAVATAGDPVGYLKDKSGKGKHFTQATASLRPTFQVFGGVNCVKFDAVDDILESGDFTKDPATGWSRIGCIRRYGTCTDAVICAGASSGASGASGSARLGDDSGKLYIYDGGSLVETTGTWAQDTWYVVYEQHQSGAGKIQIDNGTIFTGDPGSQATIGTRLGSRNFSSYQPVAFAAYLEINRPLTATELNNLRTFFGALVGKAL